MDTYEAITYSLYSNTKDLSYKNGHKYIVSNNNSRSPMILRKAKYFIFLAELKGSHSTSYWEKVTYSRGIKPLNHDRDVRNENT